MTTSERLGGGILPQDGYAGTLLGRVWLPEAGGPSPVAVRQDGVFDVSARFATVRDVIESGDPAAALNAVTGVRIGSIDELVGNTGEETRDPARPWLLAPVDLQTIKAAGVTFAVSMIERVIEERARGDLSAAQGMRGELAERIGADIRELRPGSDQAAVVKEYLTQQGLWSQYLEVGIGPDAEIFTKGPTLSAVGPGARVGVLSTSEWNNPEPEVALVIDASGTVRGATLGNDVNLRDVEGRSALLLPKAKDNNASCALGPFIRLFDETFCIDAVRGMEIGLDVIGADGFHLADSSDMTHISRDPLDLVAQLMGLHHQYPDGAVLLLGTMFAPIADRHAPGQGFTHERGDVVRIRSRELGSLVNTVEDSERCDPWDFGIAALMRNLAARDLLQPHD